MLGDEDEGSLSQDRANRLYTGKIERSAEALQHLERILNPIERKEARKNNREQRLYELVYTEKICVE